MSRNLIQMTKSIFTRLSSNVCDEHKEFIVNVERHILFDDAYKDKCCDFLKNASIIGLAHESRPTLVFVKYDGEAYIGIDTHCAEAIERYGYELENDLAINVGCQILSLSENIYKMQADSKELIDTCLGLELEEDKEYIDFTPENILGLICQLSVFRLENNALDIDPNSKDDLFRISLLFYIKQCATLQINFKKPLEDLVTMECVKKICGNFWNFLIIPDKGIKYLNLYQCIEYLFIPNRAQEFKSKYNMSIVDALKLHIIEPMRRDERNNSLEVLRYVDEVTMHNTFEKLFGTEMCNNELERVNNWVYDTRCSIAHFRYGQSKNDAIMLTDEKLVLMLELLKSIYNNITEEMKNICCGKVIIEDVEDGYVS